MKELLNKIGITQAGFFDKDKSYVIEFETDQDYNKAFSRLDKSDELEEDDDASAITLDTSIVVYTNDKYKLALVANFEQNKYELRVTEMKG